MKRLIIVRHAKTESGGYDRDFERALTPRGSSDATRTAQHLRDQQIVPQHIISSPAKRAISTARIFAEQFGYAPERIQQEKGLYFDYTTTDFLELVHKVDDSNDVAMVCGHNPFIYFVAENLSSNFSGDMPTCSTVILDFEVEHWSQIEARTGKLLKQYVPSMFS
jgi:phosphohistidine phosphatase